jgi:hypothetical protein
MHLQKQETAEKQALRDQETHWAGSLSTMAGVRALEATPSGFLPVQKPSA